MAGEFLSVFELPSSKGLKTRLKGKWRFCCRGGVIVVVVVSTVVINHGKRIEWSPIRSVIIRVITKSDDHLPIIHKDYNFREAQEIKIPLGNNMLEYRVPDL